MKRVLLASVAGVEVVYTGEELRQDDQDVFLQVVHLARLQELGETVHFTCSSILTAVGWTHNSESYDRLSLTLERLMTTALSVTFPSRGETVNFTGSLVRNFKWRRKDGAMLKRWQLQLEPEIVALFGPTTYTRLVWDMRLTLSPMGKGLHSFYSTHHEPLPYAVHTLYDLLGSEAKELKGFRQKLKAMLKTLVKNGFFISAYIDPESDLVHVVRSKSGNH